VKKASLLETWRPVGFQTRDAKKVKIVLRGEGNSQGAGDWDQRELDLRKNARQCCSGKEIHLGWQGKRGTGSRGDCKGQKKHSKSKQALRNFTEKNEEGHPRSGRKGGQNVRGGKPKVYARKVNRENQKKSTGRGHPRKRRTREMTGMGEYAKDPGSSPSWKRSASEGAAMLAQGGKGEGVPTRKERSRSTQKVVNSSSCVKKKRGGRMELLGDSHRRRRRRRQNTDKSGTSRGALYRADVAGTVGGSMKESEHRSKGAKNARWAA